MTYEMNTVTDRIDARVRILAAKAISGEMNENTARWEILGAITEAAPWKDVAYGTPDIDNQLRADLSDSLFNLVESKLIEVRPGGFDLRHAVKTGACGWARQLSKSAVPSRLRDIRNLGRKSVSVDPLTNPSADIDGSSFNQSVTKAFHNHAEDSRSIEEEMEEMSLEVLREVFSEAAAGTRRGRHLHLGARVLINGFHLPEPIRPADFLEREQIRLSLEADPELARKTVASMFALTESVQNAEHAKIADMLLAVWDNFTPEQTSSLAQKPAVVANMIMLSAVSGLPKPSRDSIDQTVGLLVTISGNDASRGASRAFRPIAKQLVASWAAVECEAVSDFNTKSGEAGLSDEKAAQRMADALEWPDISAQVAALPGAPIGDTIAAVSEWIGIAIRTFSGEPALHPAGVSADA